jgi:hypothetical protein
MIEDKKLKEELEEYRRDEAVWERYLEAQYYKEMIRKEEEGE